MTTEEYLIKKFNLTLADKGPTEIHNVNRTIMAQTLNELGFKKGAEVGVAQGWHAEILCREIPGVDLSLIDIWDKYDGYIEYRDRIVKYGQMARELLTSYNCKIYQKFSMDAVKEFPDNSLDFVFIDGGHDFKNVAMDIVEWSRKVRPGGIVYGHDYQRSKGPMKYVQHVKDCVQAYIYSHEIKPWFVMMDDIKDPKFGHDIPCWLWVRKEGDHI